MKRKTRRLTALAALRLADKHARIAETLQDLAANLLDDESARYISRDELDSADWAQTLQELGCFVATSEVGEFLEAIDRAAEERS